MNDVSTPSFVGEAILPEIQALRRQLHASPEIGLHLPQTQASVLESLEGLGVEITAGKSLSSVIAVLRGGNPGPTVLLRGDMDALPITEETALPYASANGMMHACGHDLHTAGLLGAAKLLAQHRSSLPGTVVFMFQPGEEGQGGARIMLEEGLLESSGDQPAAAYAIHLDPSSPAGQFTTKPGPIMAGANTMRVLVSGTGGHASAPHNAVDPVPVAAEIILAIQSFATRRISAVDPAVVTVTELASDSPAGNVLARRVSMTSNIRVFSQKTFELLRDELPQMIQAIGHAHQCLVDVDFVPAYPPTINDAAEAEFAIATLQNEFGGGSVKTMTEPIMASEDFSYILENIPGAFIFLGARAPGLSLEEASPLHSSTAVFDDRILGRQAEALSHLAWRRLLSDIPT